MYTKVVNTKRCLGYVIKTYLRARLQRCITIGYDNNWVISIPRPCLCEYKAWTRVRWNVGAIVGNTARNFPRKLTGNERLTFSLRQVVSLQRFDWYWESFLWFISAQKKANRCFFKYSSLCSFIHRISSHCQLNPILEVSILKQTVFFFCHFFTHFLMGANPQDTFRQVLNCRKYFHATQSTLLVSIIVSPSSHGAHRTSYL